MLILLSGASQYDSLAKLHQISSEYQGTVNIIDGDDIDDVAEIFKDTDTVSMFAPSSLTIVKRFLSNRKKITLERKLLEKLQQRKDLSSLDLVFWEDHGLTGGRTTKKSAAKNTKAPAAKSKDEMTLAKFIREKGESLTFPAVTEFKLVEWLKQKLSESGIVNGAQYISTIIDRCGTDQFILASETDKLAIKLRAEKRNQLKPEDVELLTRYEHVSMIWDLTDAICSRNKQRSLYLIDKMLRSPEDAPLIFASVAKQFKLLYIVKKYGGQQAERIKKLFGVKDYPYTKLTRYAGSFTEKQLQTLFSKMVNLDFSSKQGKIDTKLGLDLLIATL